ncbi:MAG: oligosaccharide flippase family protein [Deinococcaceae bacterium]
MRAKDENFDLISDRIGIQQRAKASVFAVIIRQICVQLLNLTTAVTLARSLPTEIFGLYSIVGFFVSFITVMGGVSLSYALVVKQTEPTESEYNTLFTLQFLASLLIAGMLFWVNAGHWAPALKSHGTPDIVSAVAISLVLLSFQSTPQIRLERHLAFSKIAIYEVAQAVVFNLLAIVLCKQGFGARGLAIALIGRVLTGVLVIHLFEKIPLRFNRNFSSVLPELRYGLIYTSGQAINLVKDTISPIFVGSMYGVAVVGYINFATMIASYPVVIMGVLQRVITSYFAKTKDPETLSRHFRQLLMVLVIPLLLASLGIYLSRNWIVHIFGDKWLPTLQLFLPFTLLNVFLLTAMLCICLLNALGKPKWVSYLMGMWTVSTWILGASLLPHWGWASWGWINCVVQLLNIGFYYVTEQITGIRMFKPVLLVCLGYELILLSCTSIGL